MSTVLLIEGAITLVIGGAVGYVIRHYVAVSRRGTVEAEIEERILQAKRNARVIGGLILIGGIIWLFAAIVLGKLLEKMVPESRILILTNNNPNRRWVQLIVNAYPVDSGSRNFTRLIGFLVTAIPSRV